MTKAREIKKELQEAGWTFEEGGRHTLAISPDGKTKVPIPRHGGKDRISPLNVLCIVLLLFSISARPAAGLDWSHYEEAL